MSNKYLKYDFYTAVGIAGCPREKCAEMRDWAHEQGKSVIWTGDIIIFYDEAAMLMFKIKFGL